MSPQRPRRLFRGNSLALPSLSVGEWYDYGAGSQLSVAAQNLGSPGNGVGALVFAWVSACWDSSRGRVTKIAAGGHGDYPDNGGYAFDPRVTAGTWTRFHDSDTSAVWAAPNWEIDPYTSGNPAAVHHYGGQFYVPGRDEVFRMHGVAWGGSATPGLNYAFNMTTNTWGLYDSAPTGILKTNGICAVWDSVNALVRVWARDNGGSSAYATFTPSLAPASQWSSVTADGVTLTLDNFTGTLDTTRSRFVIGGIDSGNTRKIRYRTLAGALTTVTVTAGAQQALLDDALSVTSPGFAYDPADDSILIFNPFSAGTRNDMYKLTDLGNGSNVWTITKITTTGASVPPACPAGNWFKQFDNIAPGYFVAICPNNVVTNAFLYRNA